MVSFFRARPGAPLALLALVCALLIYQPWHVGPFDIYDFSEFLPLLRHRPSVAGRFMELTTYYGAQGRANLLPYAVVAVKWSLVGDSSVAWHWARFALMLVNVALTYAALRQLGAATTPAAFGAALMLVAAPAAESWYKLTIAEPLALAFLLAATIAAARYQLTLHFRRAALCIAALLTCVLLTKEVLAYTFPFVLLLALSGGAGASLGRRLVSPRNVWLVAGVIASTGTVLAALAVVAVSARSDAFVSSYGESAPSAARYLIYLSVAALPAVGFFETSAVFQLVGNVPLVLVTVWGWATKGEATPGASRAVTLLAALSLPVLGAAAYVPWPYFYPFYALPMVLCASVLVAAALTRLRRVDATRARIAYAGCALGLGCCTTAAYTAARRVTARMELNRDVALLMASYRDAGLVVVTARRAPQDWQQRGATLRRYALATGSAAVPNVTDVLCAEGERLWDGVTGSPRVVIVFDEDCRVPTPPDRRLVRRFSHLTWPPSVLREDSIQVLIKASPATHSATSTLGVASPGQTR